MNGYEMSRIREDIHKRMWVTSCGYTLENVNFPGWGNSLKCKFPHMRIYSYYCEFPLVEVHPKMCNSAVWIFTKFSEFPHAEIHCSVWIPSWGKVYYLMRIYTRKGEFPKTRKFNKLWFSTYEDLHLQLCISTCGNAPKNAYIRCADIHNFWCITACGDTQFNVNSFTRKSVFPRTRICTVLSELPHVEIHKSMCKSAHGEIRFSTCGYSHKFVYFHMRRCTQNGEFSNTVHSNLNVVNTELLMEAQVILSISGDCSYTCIKDRFSQSTSHSHGDIQFHTHYRFLDMIQTRSIDIIRGNEKTHTFVSAIKIMNIKIEDFRSKRKQIIGPKA